MVHHSPESRFQQKIKELIEEGSKHTGDTEVMREQVEQIGRSEGMSEVQACIAFLSLRGRLWDVRTGSLLLSTIMTEGQPTSWPRDWTAIANVYLF